jgi:hypothetical protein
VTAEGRRQPSRPGGAPPARVRATGPGIRPRLAYALRAVASHDASAGLGRHADDVAADEQGHAEQGPDAPVDQQRVPYRGVVHGGEDRLTGLRDPAGESAASGMRTPCRTSSSMPLAAVATSCPADRSSSSTAAVSAWSTFFTRSARASSRDCSSSLDSAASVTASMSRSRSAAGPAAGPDDGLSLRE